MHQSDRYINNTERTTIALFNQTSVVQVRSRRFNSNILLEIRFVLNKHFLSTRDINIVNDPASSKSTQFLVLNMRNLNQKISAKLSAKTDMSRGSSKAVWLWYL